MALDHYVSQVYLKQFLHQPDKRLLYAVRKSDLKTFTPRTKDVCRTEQGSTNAFLKENRVVEEFLRTIEPAYEPCLVRTMRGTVDMESISVFAGFLAYILTYTPTALRMFDPPVRAALEKVIQNLDGSGKIEPISVPSLPDWDGKTLSTLKAEGKVRLDIDLKMPQAMATAQMNRITQTLAACDVSILRPKGSGRFLTSDFPSVILGHVDGKFAQRFLPLSPFVGLIFHTETFDADRDESKVRFFQVGEARMRQLNFEIIKAAEELVFSHRKFPWLRKSVRSLAHFRTDTFVENIGPFQLMQQRTGEVH